MNKALTWMLGAIAACMLMLGSGPRAEAASEPQEIVERARLTAEKLLAHPEYGMLRKWMDRAKGALVVPSLLKAGFLLGVEGGSGVLLVRDPAKGWSYPAFYTLGSGSIGAQIGVQDAQVIFVIMTDKGLRAMIEKKFKLGAEASIAVGPEGAGVEGATTAALGPDIYSFAMTRGVFGGVSFEGTFAIERDEWNETYYGKGATPDGILFQRKFANSAADGLRQALRTR